ncbi:hypothetical protein C5Y96_17735 [Blastopirellula marina]|uniref:Uncharacterized protein n=1 Tax=Blastopirellula marina TaxID=124 RepID=A0A2S8F5F2_9BACT|nr:MULTISPECIES: hypothetical protein [Pirellulaceae]PQO27383.1 hypothetical protein C5Y96_17735 [Blastopirellula marina]RCS47920.1 hypothetical protein DTL36_17760 [Bremerella cremea]
MDKQQQAAIDGWMKFLNPDSLRANLIACSMYLAAWEILKNSVIEHLKGFYVMGFDEKGDKISPEYKTRVLDRHKSPFRSSLLWFQEMGALSQADLDLADELRGHRNDIGHKLPQFLSAGYEVDVNLFIKLFELVAKIDRWWLINYELDIGDIDENEIESGNMLFIRLMLSVVAGDEEATKIHDELQKQWTEKTSGAPGA